MGAAGQPMGMNMAMGGARTSFESSPSLMNKSLQMAQRGANLMNQGQQQPQGGGTARAPTSQAEAQRMQEIIQRMKMQGGGRSDWAGLLSAALGR